MLSVQREKDKTNLVELKDVDKDFSKKPMEGGPVARIHALARVSLKLQGGEFVFLTGPSGAGKTTLLKLILGLENPTAGDVQVYGQSVLIGAAEAT